MDTMLELLPLLFLLGFLGDIVGGIGDVVGGALGGIGDIPVLGDVVKAGAPIAGSIFGGPLGGAIGGGISKMMSGGGVKDILGGAATGGGMGALTQGFQQQRADSQRARQLVNDAVGTSQGAADIQMDQFNRDQPMRQGFRQGAQNFFDPTNPFSVNQGAPGNMSFGGQGMPQMPQMPQGGGGGGMAVGGGLNMPGGLGSAAQGALSQIMPGGQGQGAGQAQPPTTREGNPMGSVRSRLEGALGGGGGGPGGFGGTPGINGSATGRAVSRRLSSPERPSPSTLR